MSDNVASPEKSPEQTSGRTIARNTAFGFATSSGLRIITFLFQVFVVRQIGGEQVGQYTIVLAWAGLFGVLGDLGVAQYFAREIARDRNTATEYFWDVVSIRLILAIVASVVTVIGAILRSYSPEIVAGIALYTLTYLFSAFHVPLLGILNGNERLDITALLDVIGQIVFMAVASLFLLAGFNFLWILIASFVNFPILIILSVRIIRRYHFGPPRFRINPHLWWGLIRLGLPFASIQVALSLTFRADTVIQSSYIGDLHIGWYSMAYGLVFNLMNFVRPFNSAILPTLARQHAADPDTIRPWYYRSVKMLLFIGLPIAVGGMLLSGEIVTTLYGAENIAAAVVLAIIVWDFPVLMYTAFCGNLTTSIKQEKAAARIYVILAILNIILNLLLIPRFGIIGSAFATVLTDLVGAAQFYFLFRYAFGAGLGLRHLIRLAFSALLMGVVIMFVRDVNWLLAGVIASLGYLIFVWLMKTFTPEERELFSNLASKIRRRIAR